MASLLILKKTVRIDETSLEEFQSMTGW